MDENLSKSYFELAEKKFPGIKLAPSRLQTDTLINGESIEVPRAALTKIQNFIKIVYKASRTAGYTDKITAQDNELLSLETPNDSVLMAYDFHLSSQGDPKLIEINTNASGYLISSLLYEVTDTQNPTGDPMELLKSAFQREWKSLGLQTEASVAIIDETLSQQRMLPEFYMYKDLFTRWGWTSTVEDYQDLHWNNSELVTKDGRKISFVYNRFNDFYLRRPQSAALRQAYFSKQVIFSPQPKDYQLLADKQRLVEWSRTEFWKDLIGSDEELKLIDQVLLKSHVLTDFESLEALWKQRKKYFFKPLRMYGGKSAFKGANISRVAFERVFSDDKSMAQEFCPAPKFKDAQGTEWKYDLRFFVYRDEIHMAVARSYQGQVTNFSKPGGGFCSVKFV